MSAYVSFTNLPSAYFQEDRGAKRRPVLLGRLQRNGGTPDVGDAAGRDHCSRHRTLRNPEPSASLPQETR